MGTSKMKDMPENFFNDFNVSRGLYISSYQVVSPYKVFNLLAVANMSEKNTSRFMGGCTPLLWGATETIVHSSEK